MKAFLALILALPLMFGLAIPEVDAGDRLQKIKNNRAIKIAPLNRAQVGKRFTPRKNKNDAYERGLAGKITGNKIGRNPDIEKQILGLGITAITLSGGVGSGGGGNVGSGH